jgi:hypothetical protein
MATIQRGPLRTRPGDYNQRASTPIVAARNWRENSARGGWALMALGQTALDGPILCCQQAAVWAGTGRRVEN